MQQNHRGRGGGPEGMIAGMLGNTKLGPKMVGAFVVVALAEAFVGVVG